MANRIKEIYQYTSNTWSNGTPIGADAVNIDVKTSTGVTTDLQTVLGVDSSTTPSNTSIQGQLNSKVDVSGGDVGSTEIADSSTIIKYDLNQTETSTDLISSDLSTDTSVVVTGGNGESTATMWSKFNRFRKRVDNKFKTYFSDNLTTAISTSGSNTKAYSITAINTYLDRVIGYTSDTTPGAGKVSAQLSTLNSNIKDRFIYNSYLTFASYNYSNMLANVTFNDNSSSPTWMTYTNDIDTNFLGIASGTNYGGIQNKTDRDLEVLLSLRVRLNMTTDTNYTGIVTFQLWKRTGSTYSYFRHLGAVVSAVSAYPRAIFSYTWIELIPQGGSLGIRGYRDSAHTQSATLIEGSLMTVPLCLAYS